MARHLLAWLALLGTSGCSLALDGPKPNRPKNYAPKCDDSKGLVVADGLLATAVGIGSLSAFGNNEPEIGVVLGLVGVAFAASAVRGNSVVNECRAEQALFAQEGGRIYDPDEPPAGPYAVQPPAPSAAAPHTRPVNPRAPVATTAPSDPYVEPAPTAAPVAAPARPAAPQKPANPPAAAEVDPDAWRDFWTEVP